MVVKGESTRVLLRNFKEASLEEAETQYEGEMT